MRHPVLLVATLCALASLEASAQLSPIANIGPTYIDFGPVQYGQPVTVPVTIANLTSSPMNLAGGGIGGTTSFSGNGGTCSSPLAAGASCAFNYVFRPRDPSGEPLTATTSIQVTANGRTQTTPISLIGTGFGTLVEITPQTIDFGDQLVGEMVSVPVTVHNPLAVSVSFAGGGFNTSNGFQASTGTCGGTLAPGASCAFDYRFTASGLGDFTNQTSLSTIASALTLNQLTPIQVKGTGVGTPGFVQMVPQGVGFGEVKLGRRAEVPHPFTNISAGTVNFAGGGFSQESGDGGAFQGGNGGGVGCTGSTAAVGATCTIIYSFRPREVRDHAGATSLSFTRPGIGTQQVPIAVTGTGVGTMARVGPVEFDFGEVNLGTFLIVKVRVTNDGDYDLGNFIGGNVVGNGFSLTANTCTADVAPGDFCEFSYRFSASASSIGPREATTLISFNNTTGLQGTYEITLRGAGVDRIFKAGFNSGYTE